MCKCFAFDRFLNLNIKTIKEMIAPNPSEIIKPTTSIIS
jgi:hypothetical protein